MILKGDLAREYIEKNVKHFEFPELECRCGCRALVIDTDFLEKLDQLRELAGFPLVVRSFTRCPAHNQAEAGMKDSDHLNGQGADIAAETSQEKFTLVRIALAQGIARIGVGRTFIHLGCKQSLPQNVLWTY